MRQMGSTGTVFVFGHLYEGINMTDILGPTLTKDDPAVVDVPPVYIYRVKAVSYVVLVIILTPKTVIFLSRYDDLRTSEVTKGYNAPRKMTAARKREFTTYLVFLYFFESVKPHSDIARFPAGFVVVGFGWEKKAGKRAWRSDGAEVGLRRDMRAFVR